MIESNLLKMVQLDMRRTGWSEKTNDTNFIGGQTNNTILTRSYVIGLRLGF